MSIIIIKKKISSEAPHNQIEINSKKKIKIEEKFK